MVCVWYSTWKIMGLNPSLTHPKKAHQGGNAQVESYLNVTREGTVWEVHSSRLEGTAGETPGVHVVGRICLEGSQEWPEACTLTGSPELTTSCIWGLSKSDWDMPQGQRRSHAQLAVILKISDLLSRLAARSRKGTSWIRSPGWRGWAFALLVPDTGVAKYL